MADGIASAGKCKLSAVGVDEIVFFDLARVGGEILVDVVEAKALDGTADQGWNVGMLFSFPLAFQLSLHVVGAAAFSFGGGDEQVVAHDDECAGVPLGGD